jgi:hypothetical protein
MSRIFLCYRRGDAAASAGRIHDHLSRSFGEDAVFIDIEGIDAGADYVEAIDRTIGASQVLLAVIGNMWLSGTGPHGRRLDDPDDWVRAEITTAHDRNLRIIPVLVDGAAMPSGEELPDSLRFLERLNAIEIRHAHFRDDIRRLIEVVGRAVGVSMDPVGTGREKCLREAEGIAKEYLAPISLGMAETLAETGRKLLRAQGICESDFGRITGYLRNPAAYGRVAGYWAFQVASELKVDVRPIALELGACLARESREALEHQETRPLWQLLMCITGVLRLDISQSDRNHLRDSLYDMRSFLYSNRHLDGGSQCKNRISELIG